jgi:hypothetical protein
MESGAKRGRISIDVRPMIRHRLRLAAAKRAPVISRRAFVDGGRDMQ